MIHNDRTEEIKQMLTKKGLNIFHEERRLILLAIIRANYNLEIAYYINQPSTMQLEGYLKKFYRYEVAMKDLKVAVERIKKEEKICRLQKK